MNTKNGYSIAGTSALKPQNSADHSATIIPFPHIDTRTDLERLDDHFRGIASSKENSVFTRLMAFTKSQALNFQTIRDIVSNHDDTFINKTVPEMHSKSAIIFLSCITVLFCIGLIL